MLIRYFYQKSRLRVDNQVPLAPILVLKQLWNDLGSRDYWRPEIYDYGICINLSIIYMELITASSSSSSHVPLQPPFLAYSSPHHLFLLLFISLIPPCLLLVQFLPLLYLSFLLFFLFATVLLGGMSVISVSSWVLVWRRMGEPLEVCEEYEEDWIYERDVRFSYTLRGVLIPWSRRTWPVRRIPVHEDFSESNSEVTGL